MGKKAHREEDKIILRCMTCHIQEQNPGKSKLKVTGDSRPVPEPEALDSTSPFNPARLPPNTQKGDKVRMTESLPLWAIRQQRWQGIVTMGDFLEATPHLSNLIFSQWQSSAPTVCKIFLASGSFCSPQSYWEEWTPDIIKKTFI